MPVNGFDVWRIARGLEYPPEKFVQVITQDRSNSHGFVLDCSGHTFQLALSKKISPDDQGEQCFFWLSLDGGATGRCGIYGLRPGVCRAYPASMRTVNVVRREDVICPTDAWRDGTLLQPRWRSDLFQITVEFDIYRMAIASWNRYVEYLEPQEPIAHEQYLYYLLDFYDRLAGVREKLGDAGWSRMCDWWGTLRLEGVGPLVDTSINPGEWAEVLEIVRSEASKGIESVKSET